MVVIKGEAMDYINDHPQQITVEFNEQSLTSNELIYHAQQIAMFILENYNLSSGDIVCLYTENKLTTAIGSISIEMTGGVCCLLSSQNIHQQLSKSKNRLVLVDWLTQDKIKDNVITLNIDRMINTEYTSRKNDKIRSLESNLFQKTLIKLRIPKIENDSIILLDDHNNLLFTSKYSCSQIIDQIRDWDNLVELFADDLHSDIICNDISRYIIDIVKQLTPNDTTKFMLKLCWYREMYINNLLEQLMDLFPYKLIIQNDSGSKDPESDYDIRIGSTDGSDTDIDACVIFNEFFSQHWSLPSGIVFDTNLYPRHMNTIEPKFNINGTGLGIFITIRCDYPSYFFTEVNDYKQNQMSLIKLRKSMTGKEWHDYIDRRTIMDCDPFLNEFFSHADKTYWKYTKKLLTQICPTNQLILCALNEITNLISIMKITRYDSTKFEILWNKIHEEMRPILMEQSNILFISYLRQARHLEREIRERKDRYENSFFHPILQIPPNEMLYIDTLTVSMRHKFSKAIYFANDACVAEGSLYYVNVEQYNNYVDVSYVQDKTLRTNLLTNNQLYQSINEQYGNFLKYIKNYSLKQVHSGRTIYRSSKYLYRLLNTLLDLGKHQWNRMGFNNDKQIKHLGILVENYLLSMRKYKYPFNEMNANDRAKLSEYFALGIFPTKNQLEMFWKSRQLTLDQSSELYQYKNYSWNQIQILNYEFKIQNLLIEDLKIFGINHQFNNLSYIKPKNCSIIKQFTSSVNKLVLDCYNQISYSHFRGLFDNIPDIIRYIFDWKITRFNIVKTYKYHKEYSYIKKSQINNYITWKNYLLGFLFGIRLIFIRMLIIAPIMFLIEPIQKSVWIFKTLVKIEQPYDRILLYTRAAYTTMITGNILVVHDSRMIDIGVTINHAYGTNKRISYFISILRLLTTILIQGIVWFSWMIVITDLTTLFSLTISFEYMKIIQKLYLICLSCVSIIVFLLNTWTTIRRYLLLYKSKNVEYLATVRENQGTRAYYLSILIYIIVGIIFNFIFTLYDLEHAHWFHITPFAIIFDYHQPVHLSFIQLIIIIISQGMAIALIDVINKSASCKERLPDDELSNRNCIGKKEWLNFPIGTICSLLRLTTKRSKID